jgi:hypothetical protein
VAWRVLEAGGEQVSFDATSDAQIQLRERSEEHKKRENSQAAFGQDVCSGVEMTKEILQNSTNYAGMSMKTKDRCGKLVEKREYYRKKGSYASIAVMLLKRKEIYCGS